MSLELSVFNDPDVILAQTQAAVSTDPLLFNQLGGAVISVGGALGPAVLISTSNGVSASAAGNTLTLSMSQDLRSTGSPTFAGLTWSGYGGSAVLLRANSSGALAAVTIGSNLSFDGTTLSATGGGGTGTVNSGTANQLAYYASTGTAVSGLTSANNSVLVTNGSGAPSWATSLPSGVTLNGAAIVVAGAVTGSGLTMATARLLGRTTASTGAVEEITVGSGLSLSAGTLTATGSGGTVTTVSVVSANGFAGTVATATTTPAITLTTSITGILKGNGTAISAAVAGTDYLVSNQTISFAPTGDVTGSTTGTTTLAPALAIGSNKVTNAMLATMATATFKGRTTAGTGNAEDLTVTQATALLSVFVGDSGAGGTKGLVPAPASGDAAANKFLKADGNWTAVGATVSGANPTASVGLTAVNGSASTFLRSDGAPALSQSIAPTWTGLHTFNPSTTPQDAIFLDIAALGSTGTRDSHNIVFRGRSRNATDHPIDWKIFNDVTTTTDISQLTFANQVNGGGYTNLFTFADDGSLTAVAFVGDGGGLTSIDGGQVVNVVGSSNGGAGSVSGILKANGSGTVSAVTIGTGLSFDGTTLTSTGAGGTVTTVSVVSANGFAGSVANATTTPAITLSTSITGLLKGNGTAISAAAAGTDYEVPLTFSTGLTRSTNTITVNTSQNIATLSNLTSNGFVKTSGGVGTLSIDTSTYLTANQTITLSGDVTGSGSTAITATLATVNSNVGTFGSATQVAQITVNAKGLVTAASNVTITGTSPVGSSLTSGSLWIGNGSNVAAAVAMSGDVTITNAGVTAIGALKVTNAMLAGSIDLTAKVTNNLPVTNGGTGRATSTTAFGLLAAGTTATGAHQTLAAGLTTEILVGGGTSALPVWTTATGSGAPVRATSPTLVTPVLGTPTSGTLTNCTGLPISGGLATIATLSILGRITASTGNVETLTLAQATTLVQPVGFMFGMGAEWVSTTQVKIKSGYCYIESLGYCIYSSSDLTATIPTTGSAFSTANGAVASSGNILLNSTSGYPTSGRGQIDSEQFDWTSISGNSLVVPGGSRGVNGTTATTHSSGAAVTYGRWLYVYMYLSGSTPTLEITTTAPAAAFAGNARSKTSDTSRRWVFSMKTYTDNTLFNFSHDPNTTLVQYRLISSLYPFRIIGPGTAFGGVGTSLTTIDASIVAPPQCISAYVRVFSYNTASAGANLYLGAPGQTLGANGAGQYFAINPSTEPLVNVTLNTSQQYAYIFDVNPSPGATYEDLLGYYLPVS